MKPKQARLHVYKIVPDVAEGNSGDKNEKRKMDRRTPRRCEAMVNGKAAPN